MDTPELARIADYIFLHAKKAACREAVVFDDCRLTYAELAERVQRTSRALLASGVKHGDRVTMLSAPRPEFLILAMAVADIGAIWVGLNPRYKRPELRYTASAAAPVVQFAFRYIDGRDYRDDLDALRAEFPTIEETIVFDDPWQGAVGFEDFESRAEDCPVDEWRARRSRVGPDDTAAIIFTSGTTGEPKGAMIKHYALINGARIENDRWPSRTGLRMLNNMPNNHIAGLGMLTVTCMVAGGTLIFMDHFDARDLLHVLDEERVTFWLQAPTMFHLAVTHCDFERSDLSALEYIVWAGSPMPRDLVTRLHAMDATLSTAFGMTELGAYVTYSDVDAGPEVLGDTLGRPESRYELRIADAAGRSVSPGQQGEIQARGRWVISGYFRNATATAEAFTDDGWFRTGDVAVERPDGNWSMVGRLKEMYKSGGYNIYPREIEMVIESHPAVAAAAVLGVPDDLYQEVGFAFAQVEPQQSVTEEALRAWCRERLANYKVPKRFEIRAELPRLPIGKLDKQALRKTIEAT